MGFLQSVFGERRTSMENPSFDLNNPPDWAFDMFGSRKSSAGVNINPETALTLDTVWRGINLIGGDCGKLPLHVYRQLDGGGKDMDKAHPAYTLLRYKPNEAMTAFHWRRLMTAWALTRGNGYSYIYRGPDFRPLELVPLSPDLTYPIRVDGVVWYVTRVGLEVRKIPRHDMLHIKGFSPDGLQGYNWVQKAKESLGLGIASQMYSSVFFRNSARPNVVITYPSIVDKQVKDQLRDAWERMQSGLENAHRTAILDRGGVITPLSINAKDSQLIQTMEFSRVQVANFLGVPPHKLGDDSRTAYASLEQENQAYLDDGLDPWLVNWEEECWDKLLTEEEKASHSHTCLFDRRKLIRADIAARTTYYVSGLTNGWLCLDDVREEEDLNPLPDELGQDFLRPLNMAVIGEEPPEPAPVKQLPPPDDERSRRYSDDQPREPDGKFGSGGGEGSGGGKVPASTSPAVIRREVEGVALKHYNNQTGLLAKMKKGEYDPKDVITDSKVYTKRAIAANTAVYHAHYQSMKQAATKEFGAEAMKSKEWGAVKDAFVKGRNDVRAGIVSLHETVKAIAEHFDKHPDTAKITRADHDQIASDRQKMKDGAYSSAANIRTAYTAFSKKHETKSARRRTARFASLLDANGAILTDALGRMARRVATHARRAAKEPGAFVSRLDAIELEQWEPVVAALTPPLTALSTLKRAKIDPSTVAKMLFQEAKAGLLEASGRASAATLEGEIERSAALFEADFPAKLTEILLKRG